MSNHSEPTRDLDILRRMMRPFATSIGAKADALGGSLPLSSQHQQRLRESISDDIKKATNFHRHRVSVAAHLEASSREIDLASKTWHDQPRFDPKRRLFVVEHKVTVGTLRDRCIGARDTSGILNVLVNDLVVVWVLREVDDKLTRLGFRTHRPDPDRAYEAAGIKMVPEHELP